MKTRTLVASMLCCLAACHSTRADLVLSFVPQSATTVSIGDTIDVDLVLTQTSPAIAEADITSDGLTSFNLPLLLDNSNLSAASTPVANSSFSDLSSIGPQTPPLPAPGFSLNPELIGFSITPVLIPSETVTLGTYRFVANSAGTTTITLVNSGTITQFGFGSVPGPGDIDSQIFSGQSLALTAVPEPNAFLLMAFVGCVAGLNGYLKRRMRGLRKDI